MLYFLKKNNFFIFSVSLCLCGNNLIKSSNTVLTENLTVQGAVLFDSKVTTNQGINTIDGIFTASGKININGDGVNSFSVMVGNATEPSLIYFNNIPTGNETQKLGYLTIDPNGVVYVSFDITPLPTDPYQTDTLTAEEILNKNDTTILINSVPSNTLEESILGNTVIGNNDSNVTIAAGNIIFNGPISTNFPNIFFSKPCYFIEPITTNIIKTTNAIIGSENLISNIILTITQNTTIITSSFLAKNNLTISAPEESITFENNNIEIGTNSPQSSIIFSPLSLPQLSTVTTREENYTYLALIKDSDTSDILCTLPPKTTVDYVTLDKDIEINYINANNQNNTIISAENITFQTAQITLDGYIDSNLQTLSISPAVIFEDDVFIGTSSVENFIAKKKMNVIEAERRKKQNLKKEIENFYKEIVNIYEKN